MAVFRAPANIQLRKAQIALMLATLVPTVLMTAVGIVLLAIGSDAKSIVSGVLVLAFCTSSLTGYILGSIFVSRGASIARFQNDFLSSVSHELKTPLTSIGVFIETLQDKRVTDPKERDQCLSLMQREISRLGALVSRLSSLSRIEASGPKEFHKETLPLSSIIHSALDAFETATLNDRTGVETNLPPGLMVYADKQALEQVLTNLLVNAWKYTPTDKRKITLTAKNSGTHTIIEVQDNGTGIPRGEQQAIFEQFERGKTAIDDGIPGSGLGLAIARAIIRAHKGKLSVQSKLGKGSTFTISLKNKK